MSFAKALIEFMDAQHVFSSLWTVVLGLSSSGC